MKMKIETRTRAHRGQSIISDINVTPFVDVLLVLLVISIITLPVVISGIRVNLPKVTNASPLTKSPETITLSVAKNDQLYLNDKPMTLKKLEMELSRLRKKSDEAAPILLNADASTQYQFLVTLIESLHKAHYYRIGFVTTRKETQK